LGDLVTPLFRSENIDWGKSLRVCIMYWARKASDPALQVCSYCHVWLVTWILYLHLSPEM